MRPKAGVTDTSAFCLIRKGKNMPPFLNSIIDKSTGTLYVNGQPVWKGADQMSISVSDYTTFNPIYTDNMLIDTDNTLLVSNKTFIDAKINAERHARYWNTCMANAKKPEPAPIPALDNYWEQPGNKLVVKWTDGTITTVTAEDPEHATLFAGICIAFAKKVLGSTTAITKQIETVQKKKEWPRRKREIEKEKLKELNESIRERKAEIREMKIRNEMEDIMIHREAVNRVFEKEAKEKYTDSDKAMERLNEAIDKAILFGDAQEEDDK